MTESSAGFRSICERVCQMRGWELRPNGVLVPLDDGRHQVVAIELFEHDGARMVRLSTGIGSADALSEIRLRASLELNASLPHGAFGLRRGELVMIETMLLSDVDAGELEAAIAYLAETADRYEEQIFGTDDY